jgi:hypothetical protein
MTFCLGGCITNAFTQISSFCCFTFVWGAQLKLTTGVPFDLRSHMCMDFPLEYSRFVQSFPRQLTLFSKAVAALEEDERAHSFVTHNPNQTGIST